MSKKIIPILQCRQLEDAPLSRWVYRYPETGETVRLCFGFCAVKTETETILVDCGLAVDEELQAMNGNIISFAENERSFTEILAEKGIQAEEVTKVILTHLHWDHAWNVDKLPHAVFYVQRKELEHAVAPYEMERPHYGYKSVKGFENPPFTRVLHRTIPLDGSAEIVPGIRVIPTPGHTVGSQSVLIDTGTEEGTYAIIGDLSNLKKGYEEGYLPAYYYSLGDCYESRERVEKEHAKIICVHDPETYTHAFFGK